MDQVPHEDIDVHISDSELEDGSFLQPYSSRQRQALLLAAGVKRIDKEEKRQLHALRVSREDCGCDCQGFCEPETCACSLAGIKCQVRHLAIHLITSTWNFPADKFAVAHFILRVSRFNVLFSIYELTISAIYPLLLAISLL